MDNTGRLKLFISYSHNDETQLKIFNEHIAPLVTDGSIEVWHDQKNLAGQYYQGNIDNNMDKADIILLFISKHFLSSKPCMEEKTHALILKKKKGISVVPVILSACGWQDDKEISPLLALPKDGKPISDYANSDTAWLNVYNGLKGVIKKEKEIRQLNISEQFSSFLQNTGLLANAHSQKEIVLLEDIFVYPDLVKYDDYGEYEKKVSSKKLLDDFCDYTKILIAGEDQSGKTTLCKKIFIELREINYVPVYLSNKANQDQGKIETQISKAFKEQYKIIPIEEIDRCRIVPIIDDFHFAKNKEKQIFDLSQYDHQIIIVDDIFSLNIKYENIIKSFTRFKIKEYIPSLRNQLIEKWTRLTEKKNDVNPKINKTYENIDNTTELVNSALGKIFGSGIMPAFPFFILSVINIYETVGKPLDQEITSQGYCYQALIYMYLRKQGVENDEIDTYINFLTEFSFFFYSTKKKELSVDEFSAFMESYSRNYNFPLKQEILIKNLQQTKIIELDSFNNYSFCYPYLYYFFVAKYLSEHAEENKDIIAFIINNLHKDENAYITIFISHHSKHVGILEEIILNACCLFEKYKPATLNKEEISFFDEQADNIVKAVLPPINITPEKERATRLEAQDINEQNNGNNKRKIIEEEESDNEYRMELRRSIKTVEVMGRIVKNRAGSLDKMRLEYIFEEAMKVHLRILSSFFELIKDGKVQQEIVSYISDRINKVNEGKESKNKSKPSDREKDEKISRTIFWNMNFFVVYGFINKIIHSLGSNKLTAIIEKVCNSQNTPASFLVKHGILMWYNKNLQIDNIANNIEEDGFSETAKRIMRFMIVNHCSMHSIGFKEKQRLEYKLRISSKKLLIQQAKGNDK